MAGAQKAIQDLPGPEQVFIFKTMNPENPKNENKKIVHRIDHSKIKDGEIMFLRGIYDDKGNYLRPVPYVEKTEEEIEKEIQELNGHREIEKIILEKIDVSKFTPLSSKELSKILGLTIKRDEENKLVTFLCQLSAFTENSQFNISFNAPSSTGKSYIPLEIARLFPKEDIIKTGYASPTAFFHDKGSYKKELEGYEVNLERKILIFLDQPHNLLLQHLRPLLSHDEKEILLKITDKSQKYGLRTKNILLRGYSSVIFCTAGLKIDEQEATRMILLSPEINQEKIREAIHEKIKKESDIDVYKNWLEENPERKLLKERILAIKQEEVKEIIIKAPEKIEEVFLNKERVLKPRDARDVSRLMSLIKSFALLNLWFRERSGPTIVANEDDTSEALRIWGVISPSQELGISPYIYELFSEVLLPAFNEKNQIVDEELSEVIKKEGLTRQEIITKHFQIYGRPLPDWKLRREIIPMWEAAGLITQEENPDDKRNKLIYPTTHFPISEGEKK